MRMNSDHGGSPAASRKVHTCTVHAASLQYSHKELGEGDAVLSSCDSFIFGGQVEPYTYAEPDACEHVQLSHQDVDGVTDRLAMSKAFFYKQRLDRECIQNGLSNLLAGYPILAGRLRKTAKPGPACVHLTNSGVPFCEVHIPATSKCFIADELDMQRWTHAGLPVWSAPMDCNKLTHGKEALMKVVLIQLLDETSILSVTLAHCIADGSGFTRILQSLALMCSNQPGLPMMFGAGHLKPPEPSISKEASAGCTSATQVHLHQTSLVFQPKTDLSSRLRLASRLLPGLCSSMVGTKCKQVVYLPAKTVQALKAEMQLLVPTRKLSSNDVLSAVLWNVACDIRGKPRPFCPNSRHHGCLAYPLNLRGIHVPQEYCGNALLLNLLAGGDVAKSEAPAALSVSCCSSPQSPMSHEGAAGYERDADAVGREADLQQLADCAARISRHTSEARSPGMVLEAMGMVDRAATQSALAKRLGLVVLGVDVDLWVSNWSNLYQLDGMQIGIAKPYMFLGHSIGPQLGTAAVILQPDKTCYHVDWYIPARLSTKLKQHKYWSLVLSGSAWL